MRTRFCQLVRRGSSETDLPPLPAAPCSSWPARRSSTLWSCRTCTVRSCPTSAPHLSVAPASCPAATLAGSVFRVTLCFHMSQPTRTPPAGVRALRARMPSRRPGHYGHQPRQPRGYDPERHHDAQAPRVRTLPPKVCLTARTERVGTSLDHLANNIASATFDVINAGDVRTADMGGKRPLSYAFMRRIIATPSPRLTNPALSFTQALRLPLSSPRPSSRTSTRAPRGRLPGGLDTRDGRGSAWQGAPGWKLRWPTLNVDVGYITG